MNKSSRTFRIAQDLSSALDQLHTRSGDHTYHVEQALRGYPPIKKILKDSAKGKQFLAEKGYKSVLDMPARFNAPTLHDVMSYMMAQGLSDHLMTESEKFMDFYDSKGWMVGKNKMKDWEAAARNWIKRIADNKKPDDKGPMSRLMDKEWAEGMVKKP